MMTVKEYALDVNKTVDEILKKCLDLDIRVNDEEDLLEEDDDVQDVYHNVVNFDLEESE